MGVASLLLTAVLLTALGFATAVFDHGRQLRQAQRQAAAPMDAAASAGATGSEPPG